MENGKKTRWIYKRGMDNNYYFNMRRYNKIMVWVMVY